MSRRKLLALEALIGILLVAGGIWGWARTRPDPQIVKATAMSDEIFDSSQGMPDITKPEVRERFEALGKQIESMPEEKRQAFFEQQREVMQTRMEEHIDRYLAMSPEEKTAELDRTIDQMERMRKTFEQERGQRGEGNGRGNGPPRWNRGPRDSKTMNERRRDLLDATSPELRAKGTQFMTDLFNRMKERGIEPPPMPGL